MQKSRKEKKKAEKHKSREAKNAEKQRSKLSKQAEKQHSREERKKQKSLYSKKRNGLNKWPSMNGRWSRPRHRCPPSHTCFFALSVFVCVVGFSCLSFLTEDAPCWMHTKRMWRLESLLAASSFACWSLACSKRLTTNVAVF